MPEQLAFILEELAPNRGHRERLGIRRDFDVKRRSVTVADEGHQVRGITELADLDHPGRQIAAQGHQMPDAVFTIALQHLAHLARAEIAPGQVDLGDRRKLAALGGGALMVRTPEGKLERVLAGDVEQLRARKS